MKRESKGLAVITGASTGIGAIYADRLAQRGYDLLLVARSETRLADLAKKLGSKTKSTVDILAADLTKSSDLARLSKSFVKIPESGFCSTTRAWALRRRYYTRTLTT